MNRSDILIIGGGLTGLTLQYLLRNETVKIILLQARKRLGGRIHTINAPLGASIEMGATWLGAKHTRLNSLIKELRHALYQKPYLTGMLFVAGSETANGFPGYMEGAVRIPEGVFHQIITRL